MPAINFPDSPTLSQVFTSGLQSWIWDGISWNIIPTVSGGGEASIFVGPTAPPAPDDGDLWWDTDEPSLLNSIVDPVALANDDTFQAELDNRYSLLTVPQFYDQVCDSSLVLSTSATQVSGISHTVTMLHDGLVVVRFAAHINVTTTGAGECTTWLRTILNGGAFIDHPRHARYRETANSSGATVANQQTFSLVKDDTLHIRLFASKSAAGGNAQVVTGLTSVVTTVHYS